MLKLHVLNGPRKGRTLVVKDDDTVTIGREHGRLRLHDARVSKQHAEITFDGETWFLHDLGAANGTYLNKQQLRGTIQLAAGDLIQCGQVLIKAVICDAFEMTLTNPQASGHGDAPLGTQAESAPPIDLSFESSDALELERLFSEIDDTDEYDLLGGLPKADPFIDGAPNKPAPETPQDAFASYVGLSIDPPPPPPITQETNDADDVPEPPIVTGDADMIIIEDDFGPQSNPDDATMVLPSETVMASAPFDLDVNPISTDKIEDVQAGISLPTVGSVFDQAMAQDAASTTQDSDNRDTDDQGRSDSNANKD